MRRVSIRTTGASRRPAGVHLDEPPQLRGHHVGVAQRLLQLVPEAVRPRPLEVPPGVVAAGPAAQREPVGGQPQVRGVDVGGLQPALLRRVDPGDAGQVPEVGQRERRDSVSKVSSISALSGIGRVSRLAMWNLAPGRFEAAPERRRTVDTRSRAPARSPGSLVGNPPPRWGAPGDDRAGPDRARQARDPSRVPPAPEAVRHVHRAVPALPRRPRRRHLALPESRAAAARSSAPACRVPLVDGRTARYANLDVAAASAPALQAVADTVTQVLPLLRQRAPRCGVRLAGEHRAVRAARAPRSRGSSAPARTTSWSSPATPPTR